MPFSDARAGAGHVWIPYERDVVREAPQIEPGMPLTQQVEATLRNHYAANATAAVSHGSQPTDRSDPRQQPADSRATHATVRLATAQPAPEPEPGPMPPPRLPQRPPPPVAPPPEGEQAQTGFAYGGEQQQAPPQQQQAPPPEQQPFQQPQQPFQQPPPYGYQPAPPPAYGYQQQQPPAEPDPLAVLSGLPAGHVIEIELSGNLTISGELRHVRIVPPDDPGFRR